MTRLPLISFIASLLLSSCTTQQDSTFTQQVNPFTGTGGHGHTYPGATSPFGMVQLSPDSRLTGWDGCSGYHYSDSLIFGFSHTHLQGTGISDYGDILFIPTGGKPLFAQDTSVTPEMSYASSFSRNSEMAEPGYYSVFLDEPGAKIELTAGKRTGIQRYTFASEGEQYVTIDLHHRDKLLDWKLEQINEYEIRGYRISEEWAKEQHVYFYSRFSAPVATILENADSTRPAVFSLKFSGVKELTVSTALSVTSMEGALANLESEPASSDFDKTRTETAEAWNKELSLIKVKAGVPNNSGFFIPRCTTVLQLPISFPMLMAVTGAWTGRCIPIPDIPNTVYSRFGILFALPIPCTT